MAKEIIRFTVDKIEDQKVETKRKNKETGEEEIVVKNKKVNVPVEFVLKAPTRRQREDAELFYSVELSKAVKKGILTKAMLIKKYADTGGALTEQETKDLLKKIEKSNQLSSEIQLLTTEDKEKNKEEIETKSLELVKIRKEMIDLESAIQGVYQHTADSKAERALLLWYVINLIKKIEEDKEVSFFDGIDYEEKLENLYEKEESDDSFNSKVIEKMLRAISFWMYGGSSEEKDFLEFINRENE